MAAERGNLGELRRFNRMGVYARKFIFIHDARSPIFSVETKEETKDPRPPLADSEALARSNGAEASAAQRLGWAAGKRRCEPATTHPSEIGGETQQTGLRISSCKRDLFEIQYDTPVRLLTTPVLKLIHVVTDVSSLSGASVPKPSCGSSSLVSASWPASVWAENASRVLRGVGQQGAQLVRSAETHENSANVTTP